MKLRSRVAGLALGAALGACVPHPSGGSRPLRDYHLLIEGHDPLSEELAKELRARGFVVERQVAGGGPEAAAVIWFTFRDPEAPGRSFGLRLADTRTGTVVAAVSLPLDSLGDPPAAAQRLSDSIVARLAAP